MKLYERIEDARRNHDMRDILNMTKKVINCPLPQHQHLHNTPSFSLFYKSDGTQWFRCWGNCQCHGDVLDLVGFLRVPGYDPNQIEHRKTALALLDERYEINPYAPVIATSFRYDYWKHVPAEKDTIEYAAKRGLTMETVLRFNLGQDGNWMTIPNFESGILIGIKKRNMGPGQRYMSTPHSKQGLFNRDVVEYSTKPVIIAKGEICAMLLTQYAFLACAPTAGEGALRSDIRTMLALSKNIVIGDNDTTGRKWAPVRAELLNADLYYPPDPYKDVDEWILSDLKAISKIQGWVNHAAKRDY